MPLSLSDDLQAAHARASEGSLVASEPTSDDRSAHWRGRHLLSSLARHQWLESRRGGGGEGRVIGPDEMTCRGFGGRSGWESTLISRRAGLRPGSTAVMLGSGLDVLVGGLDPLRRMFLPVTLAVNQPIPDQATWTPASDI
jgi:hypothetical protein